MYLWEQRMRRPERFSAGLSGPNPCSPSRCGGFCSRCRLGANAALGGVRTGTWLELNVGRPVLESEVSVIRWSAWCRTAVLSLLVGLSGLAGARSALAQPPPPPPDGPRVIEAIDATQRRIDLAESLAGSTPTTVVAGEIALAKELQLRATSAYASGQYFMAGRATMDARGHADRAIAMIKGLPDPERVAIQLERTQDELERAQERLADCPEPRALALLSAAKDMKARADLALDGRRYLAALQLSNGARERLQKALRICQVYEASQVDAQRALQRTDEVVARVRERVSNGASPQERQMLASAEALQADAHAEYQRGHYESSLRMTLVARVRTKRILR